MSEDRLHNVLRVGFLVNPLAGLGGPLGLKGSDNVQAALSPEDQVAADRSGQRALRALAVLAQAEADIALYCWGGPMGQDWLREAGLDHTVLGQPASIPTTAQDTRVALGAFLEKRVDLVLFCGGDGTARDVYDAVGDAVPALGIPAGVKMQSGVFAVSPEAAAELVLRLAAGHWASVTPAEVRDIDEEALQRDIVRSRFYGDLQVPAEGHYLQRTKVGGREDPELAAMEIAQWFADTLDSHCLYLIGPGSTTATIMEHLGVPNTLLGVDAMRDGQRVAADCNESQLLALLDDHQGPVQIVVTVIGGQGFIFGRGNQQLSAAVIRRVGADNIVLVAARSKLADLAGQPLLVDTNDPELDEALCGLRSVVTGYDERALYRVARVG
jgi:predicted polyphosphate/ATP-dependent NAD kinase